VDADLDVVAIDGIAVVAVGPIAAAAAVVVVAGGGMTRLRREGLVCARLRREGLVCATVAAVPFAHFLPPASFSLQRLEPQPNASNALVLAFF